MAGHSKWANIKHKKKREDAKRGKIFTKLIREITVASRMGGSDQSANPRLRAAVAEALANNMPKDTVERAVKRGDGAADDGSQLEEINYEGYGPGGVAVMVECMTDNRNRTVSEVRHAFTKAGGNLGTDGSVAYLFKRVGVIALAKEVDEAIVMDVALEAGAEDIITDDPSGVEVITAWEQVHDVQEQLQNSGVEVIQADVTLLASIEVPLDAAAAESVMRLIERLEELDDVQKVYTNADISDDVLQQLLLL